MVKVIAITGTARCGSTILDTVLGGVPGAFSVGELHHIWNRGLIQQRLCGCSKPFSDCELWSQIVQRAFPAGTDPHSNAAHMRYLRTRYVAAARIGAFRSWYDRKLQPLIELFDKLYAAIAAETGARIIIDSSKAPNYIYLVSRIPSVDLRIVHLVRDPRGVAHSGNRPKQQLDTAEPRVMRTISPLRSAMDWDVFNTSIRAMFADAPGGYSLVRYEDFMHNPEASVRQILTMAGEQDSTIEHLRGHTVDLAPNHTVSGNPGRFRSGTVNLELDDAWRDSMANSDRRVVELITAPFRKPFGYG